MWIATEVKKEMIEAITNVPTAAELNPFELKSGFLEVCQSASQIHFQKSSTIPGPTNISQNWAAMKRRNWGKYLPMLDSF